jgi:hypothetical protein
LVLSNSVVHLSLLKERRTKVAVSFHIAWVDRQGVFELLERFWSAYRCGLELCGFFHACLEAQMRKQSAAIIRGGIPYKFYSLAPNTAANLATKGRRSAGH